MSNLKGMLKKILSNAPLRNERGFTLVEMLIAFTVFFMIMAFLPLGLKTVLDHGYMDRRIQRLEWEVFNSQIKKEIRFSNQVTVQNDKILLQKNGETILYEKYGGNIRRRVNFSGHEVLLQNVSTLQFKPLPEGYSIIVTDFNNIKYGANVRAFIPIEVK